MEYASRTSRFVGQFIDGIIAFLPTLAGYLLAAVVGFDGFIAGTLILAGILGSAWYLLFADGRENGQSVGKRMMDTRVIDAKTGASCTYWQSFLRNILLAMLGPIDWIFIFGGNHQRLGDKAAGTVVVPTK